MSTSVRTKTSKKQYVKQTALSQNVAVSQEDRDFENSLLALDNACMNVIHAPPERSRKNPQRLYWQQRFINIANPVSLALMEYKGPRHFHYHYKRKETDGSVLQPILENPVDMLAQVCRDSLALCRSQLVGLEDEDLVEKRYELEAALAEFLGHYCEYRLKNR